MSILLYIYFAEASPTTTPAIRTKRFFSCPDDIKMICPTQKKHFFVDSSWSWRSFGCKIDDSIEETALKECDNSVMDVCKEKWENKPNDCSVPIPVVKQVVDYLFQDACVLHDLCYLSRNTARKDCDEWFLHNMKKICSVRKITRPLCVAAAHTVHTAVRSFGKSNFEEAKKWTEENCTPENPNGTKPVISISCPRNISMICPTKNDTFVVHSSWNGALGCKFDEPIMVTALRECNNSVMDSCKDEWEKKPNNCSSPVIKEVADNAFQGACFLHDLCYLSLNTKQKDCDDWFFHNMKQMCLIHRNRFTHHFCVASARVVHSAVRSSGKGEFDMAKNWTCENCDLEGPTSEGFQSGRESGFRCGTTTQPDEQSTEQSEPEQSDENPSKPEEIEPTQYPKQNEHFDVPWK